MENGHALVVDGLIVSYPDNPGVLQHVSLKVEPGERVGIIGPNGAGKTTFFLSLCGILRPEGGTIVLFGEPIAPGRFRPEIGMVFQHPDDQLFSPSVQDDVAFGPQHYEPLLGCIPNFWTLQVLTQAPPGSLNHGRC